jgi:hypothetical protein
MNIELLKAEIKDYLMSGGLFNPELADHRKVSLLLIAALEALEKPKYQDG